MSVATRFFVTGRRGLRGIEQLGDSGATLYYGDFGKGVRRIWAPPPDFSSLESRERRGSWRPLLVSLAAHSALLAAVLLGGVWQERENDPKLKSSSGMEVTFVADGGRRQVTQAEVRPDPAHVGDSQAEIETAPKNVVATPVPPDTLSVPGGVAASPATSDAGPAPAPRAAVEADKSPDNKDTPRAKPAVADRAEEDRWEGEVLARLQRKQRYPGEAQRLGQTDVVMIRITIDRTGHLLLAELVKSKGFALLDKEALALAKRAEPYPLPPASVLGDAIQMLVPIDYVLKRGQGQ